MNNLYLLERTPARSAQGLRRIGIAAANIACRGAVVVGFICLIGGVGGLEAGSLGFLEMLGVELGGVLLMVLGAMGMNRVPMDLPLDGGEGDE